MKHITAKVIVWLLLTLAFGILFTLSSKLYVYFQSLSGVRSKGISHLLPLPLAIVSSIVLVNGMENIKWHLKSWFYKRQKIS